MKYAVILTDGAADTPVKELGGKTPLEAANKPNIDRLAGLGEMGMVKPFPAICPPAATSQTSRFLDTIPKYITPVAPRSKRYR